MALFNSIRMGASGGGDYEVERSLRFNDGDSANLTRTSSSTSTTFTYSAWIKRCTFTGYQYIFSLGSRGFAFHTNNNTFYLYDGSGLNESTAKFRDPSAWYHIVVQINSGVATSYVNNVLVHNAVGSGFTFTTGTNETRIGSYQDGDYYFDGYQAEINLVDGSVVAPSSFAETDVITGQWNPKKYTGSYGTNGFYLNFSDNSGTTATTLGKDTSGNGNNFTPNNFSTHDSVPDSPTNNFCIMNIHDNNLSEASPHFVYSEGNLKAAWSFTGTNFDRAYGTLFIEPSDTNKYYWEATGTQNNEQMQWGIVATDTAAYRANNRNTNPTKEANIAIAMWQPYTDNGIYAIDNSGGNYGDKLTLSNGPPANGDIFSFVYDAGAGKFYVFFKGVEPTGQNYSAGTTLFDTLDTSKTYALHNCEGDGGGSTKSGNFVMNWGQDSSFAGAKTAQGNTDANGIGDFYYSVPSGAKALCSANLPDPTILLPNKHFDTLLWTGTSASHTLTGLNFQPDWFWAKSRSQAHHNTLMDSVRGSDRQLWSNRTNDEQTDANFLTSFNSNGVTLGDNSSGTGATNVNGHTYVGWNWNAGGSTVTNNDGSISSQVRANTSAGFSIVSYTGTGSNATIGHGLGVAPQTFIVKKRNDSGTNWRVYHHRLNSGSSPENYNLVLNNTFAELDRDDFNDTAPTSTNFAVGTHTSTNNSGHTYIAYCFSEVAGYSKFGSYTGNGSSDGTFVFTGFRPAFIITKRSDGTSPWRLFDNKRPDANFQTYKLEADSSGAELTGYAYADFLSNGFKIRDSGSYQNASGGTYIYLCFAESPFKNSRAR